MEEHLNFKVKDYLVSRTEFDVVWNDERKCLQTLPVPEDLQAYYDSPEYISHTDRQETLMERLYERAKKINQANRKKTFLKSKGLSL